MIWISKLPSVNCKRFRYFSLSISVDNLYNIGQMGLHRCNISQTRDVCKILCPLKICLSQMFCTTPSQFKRSSTKV